MGKLALIPLGFIFIILSPIILWNAESQNRANDYNRAHSTQSPQAGYLKVAGKIESADDFACPAGSKDASSQCIYSAFTTRRYSRSEKEECTSNTRSLKVIEKLERQQCDDKGNCTPCYLVEELNWEVVDSGKQFAQSKIGEFKLESIDNAIILGSKSFTEFKTGAAGTLPASFPSSRGSAKVGDLETVHEYIKSGTDVIIAANSDSSGRLTKGGDTFVVSTLSDADTAVKLAEQDASSATLLRVVSAAVMIFGFMMIANGILGLPLGLLKVVPIFGDRIAKGINGAVNTLSLVLGVVAWIVAYIGVIILKNIFLVGIVLVLIIAIGFGLIYMLNKRKLAQNTSAATK